MSKDILSVIVTIAPVETQIAFDRERDRYLMFHVGWRGERRVFGCVIHIEIKQEKIWIQRDGTEIGIANELIEAGRGA